MVRGKSRAKSALSSVSSWPSADPANSDVWAALPKWAVVAGLLIPAVATGITALVMRSLTDKVSKDSAREKEALQAATESLQHRNNQLNALYNVFAEITDTLSLRYVVNSTLRETVRLMSADSAILRLLKDGDLVVAGSIDNGAEITGLPPIALGEGIVGRTAKRGRILRIDESKKDFLNTNQKNRGIRSGLVVPLIVGARVVGTLNCWSRAADAYKEEDERIMEMLASQVATAVVAADTTETSERRAHHDPLTGLPNRLQLSEDLATNLSKLKEEGAKAVVAMADVDHFKGFNDEFGHKAGDVTLQKVASILRHAIRDNDLVYRYGGEEFVMIFMNTDAVEATALADRVRSAVESMPLSGENLEPVGPVTISIGLAALPDHGSDLNQLIELADAAMYKAKAAGRNRVTFWSDEAEAEAPALSAAPIDRDASDASSDADATAARAA